MGKRWQVAGAVWCGAVCARRAEEKQESAMKRCDERERQAMKCHDKQSQPRRDDETGRSDNQPNQKVA